MRTRLLNVTAALVLASAITAAAQTPAPQAAPAPGPTAPISGTIDFGGIFGDVNTEVGQIIVADVNLDRVSQLVGADRKPLTDLIAKA